MLHSLKRHKYVYIILSVLVLYAVISCFTGKKIALAGLTPLLIFYVLGFCDICRDECRKYFKLFSREDIVLSGAIILAFGIFYSWYISEEKFIYFWDYATYWQFSVDVYSELKKGIFETYQNIYQQVNDSNYNGLVGLLICVPVHLFGGSKYAFTAAVFFFLFVPGLFSLVLALLNIRSLIDSFKLPLWVIVLSGCSLPIFIVSILTGFSDCVGLLLIGSALRISFKMLRSKDVFIRYIVSLGIMLALLPLFRRWYAYWLVGYAICIILIVIANFIVNACINRKLSYSNLVNFGCSGLVAVIFLSSLFSNFLNRSMFNNYSIEYSAYKFVNNNIAEIQSLALAVGIIFLCLCFLGIFYSFVKIKAINESVLLFGISLIAVIWFWNTQSLNIQHYLLIAPQLFIMIILGINYVLILCNSVSSNVNKYIKWCFSIALVVYMSFSCLGMTLLDLGNTPFFSSKSHRLLIRNDIYELDRILEYIPKGSLVYTLASSRILNDDIMKMNAKKHEINASQFLGSSNVDLRDGFSLYLLEADYVVTCETPQTHLAPEKQRVIVDTQQMIQDPNSAVGKHYSLVEKFQLDNEIQALLLERTSDYSEEDKKFLADHFSTLYPDYPELFSDRIMRWSPKVKKSTG